MSPTQGNIPEILATGRHICPRTTLFPWILFKLATCVLRIRVTFGFYYPRTIFEPKQTQDRGFIDKSFYLLGFYLGNNPISVVTLTLTLTFLTIMLLLNVKIFRL
jgi:hypothetical protein